MYAMQGNYYNHGRIRYLKFWRILYALRSFDFGECWIYGFFFAAIQKIILQACKSSDFFDEREIDNSYRNKVNFKTYFDSTGLAN